jgi:hypothetical protein
MNVSVMQWTAIFIFCELTLADSWKHIWGIRFYEISAYESKADQ